MKSVLEYWPMITSLGGVLALLAAGALLFYLQKYFVRRKDHEALSQEVKETQSEIAAINTSLVVLDTRLAHMPTGETINNLVTELKNVDGSYKELAARLDGQNQLLLRLDRQVEGIDSFLRSAKI